MEKQQNVIMITTVDNPWNPFENYNEWLSYDTAKGYHTNERLARLAHISDVLPDPVNYQIIEDAMNQMIEDKTIAIDGSIVDYKKVYKYPIKTEKEEEN